jgi:hypothetical protein
MKLTQLVTGISMFALLGSAHACYDSFVGTENEQKFSRSVTSQSNDTGGNSAIQSSKPNTSAVINATSNSKSLPSSSSAYSSAK